MSNGLYLSRKKFKLSRTKQHDREVGGLMLNISGLTTSTTFVILRI